MSRMRRLWLLWLLAALAPAAHADETTSPAKKPATPAATPISKKPVSVGPAAKAANAPGPATGADDELLEFLGSVDTDTGDQDWIDYLAQTDVSKVAQAKKNAPEAHEVSK